MLTGDDLIDFGPLTRLVGALMYTRASGNDWPLIDAGLVRMILAHSRMLYLMGGQRGLDHAFLHLSQHIGPDAAITAMAIWQSSRLIGIKEDE
jgi:hypothetical protein